MLKRVIKKSNTLLVAIFLYVPLTCSAQEMSCKQLFMNKSERAICGSVVLIQQDAKVGVLSRRAKIVDPDYAKGDRNFRSFLKKCEGDLGCLESAYSDRISYLQATIDSGRTLTEDESAKIQLQDEKAEKRFISQEGARERYLAEQARKEVEKVDASPASQEGQKSIASGEGGSSSEIDGNEQSATSDLASGRLLSRSDMEQEVDQSGAKILPPTTGQNDFLLSIVRILIHVPWWVWLIGVIFFFAFFSRKKCRRCGRRGTSREVGRSYEGTSTDYRDVDVETKIKNARGEHVGSTSRKEQRAFKVNHYTVTYKCSNCGYKWEENESR